MRVSLRTQLLGVTVALLACLTTAALGVVYYYIGQQIRQQALRRLHAGAQVLSAVMERTEEQLLGRGRVLLQLPSLQAGLTTNRDDLEPLLQEVKALRTANLLWATDPSGVVIASTGEYPLPGTTLTHHPTMTQALLGQPALGFDEFLDGWWLVLSLPVKGQVAPTPATGSHRRRVAPRVAQPPQGEPQLLGTVTLALLLGQAYLDRLGELVGAEVGFQWDDRQFWSSRWPREVHAPMLARLPTVSPSDPQLLDLGAHGKYLWLARPVTIGIHPLVTRPTAMLGVVLDEAVIHTTANTIVWVAIEVMLVGMLVLLGATRSLIGPLKRLVEASRWVGRGELNRQVPLEGAREVAELAKSFNQMVENLRSSRDALVREKQYTDSIIRRVINSLVVVDGKGLIRIVNPATLELLGYADTELVGQPLSRLFAGVSPFVHTPWETFLQEGVLRGVETAYRSKHQKRIPVLFSSAVMRDEQGAVQGIVCIAQDITERKYLEQLKDQFIGTVSHELRTPLTTINEGVTLMLDGTLGSLSDDQRAFLEITRRETTRLRRLIMTLLDITELEGGTLELHSQALEVAPLIEEAMRAATSAAGERTLTRRFAKVSTVFADRERILQVLGHLLHNAIQFTPDDGRITVSLGQQDGMVAVSIEDNGAGIAKEDLGKLFGKFVQLGRAEDERSGGTGLGLFFCKKIIELHGGTIQVVSDLGHGATVTLTLPTRRV